MECYVRVSQIIHHTACVGHTCVAMVRLIVVVPCCISHGWLFQMREIGYRGESIDLASNSSSGEKWGVFSECRQVSGSTRWAPTKIRLRGGCWIGHLRHGALPLRRQVSVCR